MDKKDLNYASLETILNECAIMRGVPALQHRTLREFRWFVDECIFGEGELSKRYKNKINFNSPNESTLKDWGLLFYEYCHQEYGE